MQTDPQPPLGRDTVEGMKVPKFYLRDLFWLILVICMGLGWWSHVRHVKTDLMYQARLVEALVLPICWN